MAIDDRAADSKRLDDLNNERMVDAASAVATAIRAVSAYGSADGSYQLSGGKLGVFKEKVSKAIIRLTASREEVSWACEHFGWDDEICSRIDDAIRFLGIALANAAISDSPDAIEVSYYVDEAICRASRVLAGLVVWFDDDQSLRED